MQKPSAQVPIITSFSPLSGPIGEGVVITGANFSATAANNIVYFGATRAVVSSASANTITVTVPPGATLQSIAVTINGLTGYSKQPFIVTFTGAGNLIYDNYSNVGDSTVGDLPHGICVSDFDGDGKPDIATPDLGSDNNTVSLLKNMGSKGAISFSFDKQFATGASPYSITTADLDGDGKLDIITTDVNNGNANGIISVLRNISTIGNIAFAPHSDFTASSSPYSAAIGDIDGDGKPDIIVANFFSNTISIFKNISTTGSIMFQSRIDYNAGIGPEAVAVGDIDGDGKPDIAVTNFSSNSISVYKNQSSAGNISLATKLDIVSGVNSPYDIELNDIDGDGKADIAITNNNYTSASVSTVTFSLFRNTSTGNTISFTPKIDYLYGNGYKISFADINGDGKADIILPTSQNEIFIYQNNSTPGNFLFTSASIFTVKPCLAVCAADLDADNKTDMVAVNFTGNSVSFLRNRITEPYITGIAPSTAKQGDTVNIYGLNLSNATFVNFGSVPASSFAVNPSNILQGVVGSGASGKVSVMTPNGKGQSGQFIFAGAPVIDSFTPNIFGTGTTVTISGTNLLGATSVMFGGQPAQSFRFLSDTTISAIVGGGGPGNITVTTPYGTANINGTTFIPPPLISSFNPKAVQSGSNVFINGQNFAKTTAVSFGGIPALSFTVISDTGIIATVGKGASGKISVTTSYGSITRDSFFILPTINSFSPTTGRTGTWVTFRGSNFTEIKTVRFDGILSDSVSVISDSLMQAIVGAGDTSNDSVAAINSGGATIATGFIFIPPPIISAVNPTTGPAGTVVTISGKNFNSDLNNLNVRFGSIKAKVISANANSILVIVPVVADYSLINVNCYGLTAYSNQPFVTTFTNDDSIFSPGSFSIPIKLNTGSDIASIVFADLDGDSKMEIIEQREDSKQIGIIKNKSVVDTLNLLPEIIYPAYWVAGNIAVNDFDGDGRPDIMVTNESFSNTFSFFKNTSTINGNLSFAPRVDFAADFDGWEKAAVGDINGDGRPDVVFLVETDYKPNPISVSVYLNTSKNGVISFVKSVGISIGAPPTTSIRNIAIRDIDGDGKQDIILSYPTITILRNTSSRGTISFSPVQYSIGSGGADLLNVSDIDGDGKEDIIALTASAASISVFRNQSTIGSIALNPVEVYSSNEIKSGLSVGDLNGDGKPDIFFVGAGNDITNKLAILQNKSTTGNLTFNSPEFYPYPTSANYHTIMPGDLDGDSRMDLVISSSFGDTLYVLKNTIGQVFPKPFCISSGNIFFAGVAMGMNYQWQLNTGNGFENISDNKNYSGTGNDTLKLQNVQSSWSGYQYRCVIDGNNSNIYSLKFTNSWTGFVSSSWENPLNWSCGIVPDANTDVIITNGVAVLTSNATIRSLTINPSVSFTIKSPFILTITH